MGNHIFIGAKSLAEPIIFLFQIRCAELTTDGLYCTNSSLTAVSSIIRDSISVFRSALGFLASARSLAYIMSFLFELNKVSYISSCKTLVTRNIANRHENLQPSLPKQTDRNRHTALYHSRKRRWLRKNVLM